MTTREQTRIVKTATDEITLYWANELGWVTIPEDDDEDA